jgi:hypothetical protein
MPFFDRAGPYLRALFVLLLCLLLRPLAVFADAALPQTAPPVHTLNRESLNQSLPGAALESLAGDSVLAARALPESVRESRYGTVFAHAVYLYAPREEYRGRGLTLTLAVFSSEADKERAAQTARLCARLLRLFRERFGEDARFPRDAPNVRLYLLSPRPDSPAIGGETFSSAEVYLYLSGVERTALEQVRTVVHEWGHLTLPGARGYSDPESDAAGYLGERLYLRWLRETQPKMTAETDEKVVTDGTTIADLNRYYERQIEPLLQQYAVSGPNSKIFEDKGVAGMNYLIASALAFEEAFGSRLLGRALFAIEGTAPRDLLTAMQKTIARADIVLVQLPAWIPFPAGKVAVTSSRPGSVLLTGTNPIKLQSRKPLRLTIKTPQWKKVRSVAGNIQILSIRRLPEAP